MVRVKSAPCPLPVNLEGVPVNRFVAWYMSSLVAPPCSLKYQVMWSFRCTGLLALQFNRTSCPGWATVINGVWVMVTTCPRHSKRVTYTMKYQSMTHVSLCNKDLV